MDDIDFLYASDGTGEAVRAIVTGTRTVAATTLEVDSVDNWPAKFVATAGTLNEATGLITAGTITIFKGHTSGGDIIIDDFAPGYTDVGNSVGQVVVLKPNTFWADTLADVLETTRVTLADDGTLKDDIVTAPKLSGVDKSNLTTDSNPYKFYATQNAAQTGISSATKLTFTAETFDTNSNFASSEYTAPVAGFYLFYTHVHTAPSGSDTSSFITVYKNGSAFTQIAYSAGTNFNRGLTGTIVMSLAANDVVSLYLTSTGGNVSTVASGTDVPYFGGVLISRT